MKIDKEKIFVLFTVATLTVVGFIVIPSLVNKISNKVYKNSLRKDEIDWDDMGPEIERKDKEK